MVATQGDRIEYNGNWPQNYVTYFGPDGNTIFHTVMMGILKQNELSRATFFGNISANYYIHAIPLSASSLYLGRNQAWLKATWSQYLLDMEASGIAISGNEVVTSALQALLPDSGDTMVGTGLKPALLRLDNPHPFQFYTTDSMGKHWAYTQSLLGQVDDEILADVPSYGVFRNAAGRRSFVAYNPGNKAINVNFFDSSGQSVAKINSLQPGAMVADTPSGAIGYVPQSGSSEKSRLYLQKATGPQQGPLQGKLTSSPGSWLPKNDQYRFPASTDLSRIEGSYALIPVMNGNCSNVDLPGPGSTGGTECQNSNPAYAEWTGTFSGNRVGDPAALARTRMAIYTNPGLHAGWQRDPTIGTNATVRIIYDFNSDNKPDRVEVGGYGVNGNNTWSMGTQKITDYLFTCYADLPPSAGLCTDQSSGFYGLDYSMPNPPGMVVVDKRFYNEQTDFPATVTCGTVTVQVIGQSGPYPNPAKVPMPVSVGTAPVLGRASWIQPPYDGKDCKP